MTTRGATMSGTRSWSRRPRAPERRLVHFRLSRARRRRVAARLRASRCGRPSLPSRGKSRARCGCRRTRPTGRGGRRSSGLVPPARRRAGLDPDPPTVRRGDDRSTAHRSGWHRDRSRYRRCASRRRFRGADRLGADALRRSGNDRAASRRSARDAPTRLTRAFTGRRAAGSSTASCSSTTTKHPRPIPKSTT